MQGGAALLAGALAMMAAAASAQGTPPADEALEPVSVFLAAGPAVNDVSSLCNRPPHELTLDEPNGSASQRAPAAMTLLFASCATVFEFETPINISVGDSARYTIWYGCDAPWPTLFAPYVTILVNGQTITRATGLLLTPGPCTVGTPLRSTGASSLSPTQVAAGSTVSVRVNFWTLNPPAPDAAATLYVLVGSQQHNSSVQFMPPEPGAEPAAEAPPPEEDAGGLLDTIGDAARAAGGLPWIWIGTVAAGVVAATAVAVGVVVTAKRRAARSASVKGALKAMRG